MPQRPLHKPGVIPLRPLTLGDVFDGAFTTVRRNPRATIGMAALVTAGFMLIPIVGALVAGLAGGLNGALQPSVDGTGFESDAGTAAVYAANSVSGLFGALATIVVTGLIVPVVTRATLGERITTGQAWRQARGRLLALVGLGIVETLVALVVIGVPIGIAVGIGFATHSVVVAVLLGILGLLVGVLGMLGVHMRWFQLAAPVLVVERRGVFASIGRAGRLTHGQFWRVLGISLLTRLVAWLVGQVVALPFGIIGAIAGVAIPDPWGPVVLLVSSNLATIVSGAVITPFTAAVAVLLYLDQRFRKEGFDIDLIRHVQQRPVG